MVRPNRKFFQLHSKLVGGNYNESSIVYRTINVFAMWQYIFFFSDAPHLVKTARNCLYKSGKANCSCYMWNDGQYMIWDHVAKLYYSDLDCGLHQLPKLTADHIHLSL